MKRKMEHIIPPAKTLVDEPETLHELLLVMLEVINVLQDRVYELEEKQVFTQRSIADLRGY